MSADEQQFVRDVSSGLAQDDKVVSVRLSLFAETVKGKPWTFVALLAEELVATSLLTDYASKDPDTLTELVLVADAVSDKSLFPVLQQHQTAAVKNLDAPLDPHLDRTLARHVPFSPFQGEKVPAGRMRGSLIWQRTLLFSLRVLPQSYLKAWGGKGTF